MNNLMINVATEKAVMIPKTILKIKIAYTSYRFNSSAIRAIRPDPTAQVIVTKVKTQRFESGRKSVKIVAVLVTSPAYVNPVKNNAMYTMYMCIAPVSNPDENT